MFYIRQVVIRRGKELLFNSGPVMEWVDDKETKVFCRKLYSTSFIYVFMFHIYHTITYLTRHSYIRHNSGDLNDSGTKISEFFPKFAKFRTPN